MGRSLVLLAVLNSLGGCVTQKETAILFDAGPMLLPDAAPADMAVAEVSEAQAQAECTRLVAAAALCTDTDCVTATLAVAQVSERARTLYAELEAACQNVDSKRCTDAEIACLGTDENRDEACGVGAEMPGTDQPATRFRCHQVRSCLESCDSAPCLECVQCARRYVEIQRATTYRRCADANCAGQSGAAGQACIDLHCPVEDYQCLPGGNNHCLGAPFFRETGEADTLCKLRWEVDGEPFFIESDEELLTKSCLCLCDWVMGCITGRSCGAPQWHPTLKDYVERTRDKCEDICTEPERARDEPLFVRIGCNFQTCGDIITNPTIRAAFEDTQTEWCAPGAPLCNVEPFQSSVCFDCLKDDDCPNGYCPIEKIGSERNLKCQACDADRPVVTCGEYDVCRRGHDQVLECQGCAPGEGHCGDRVCTEAGNCECVEDADCGSLRCVQGACHCNDTTHRCPAHTPVCENQRCVSCRGDADCEAPLECIYGRCVNDP